MPTRTLAQIRTDVKVMAGMSVTAGHAAQSDAILTGKINIAQRQLALQYQFPELHLEQDLAIAATDNTYGLPSDIGLNEAMEVWCSWGSEWVPVTYGIGRMEQSVLSSTQHSWPIRKWEIRVSDTDDAQVLYVWPTPSQAGTLRFSGQKAVVDMAADADRSTLDGTLIALYTAGGILAQQKSADAQLRLSEAAAHAEALMSRQSATRDPVQLSRRHTTRVRPYLDYIPPS